MAKEKNERMTFDYIREIEQQKQDSNDKRAEMQKRLDEEKAKLAKAKDDYEKELEEGVKARSDNTDKLDKLAIEVKEAEETVARRANELDISRRVHQTEINEDEIKSKFRAWKEDYYEQELKPQLEKIRELKKELTKAHMDYKDAVDHYDRENNRVMSVLDPNGSKIFNILGSIEPNTRHEVERYFITANTLADLRHGKIPNGIELDDNEGAK